MLGGKLFHCHLASKWYTFRVSFTVSPAIIVFLVMNSIISVLMEYTKMEVRMLGHLVENKDRIEELMNNDVEYDASFKERLEKEDIYLPKPIELTSNISMAINLIAILCKW